MYLTAFSRLQRKFLPERFCFLDLDRCSWEDTGHYVLQQLSLVGSMHLRQILIWWIIFIFIFFHRFIIFLTYATYNNYGVTIIQIITTDFYRRYSFWETWLWKKKFAGFFFRLRQIELNETYNLVSGQKQPKYIHVVVEFGIEEAEIKFF